MNHGLVEAVEEYGNICFDCAATLTHESVETLAAEIHEEGGLRFAPGKCGRCSRRSPAIITAHGELLKRLKSVAEWAGTVAILAPLVPVAGLAALLMPPELRSKANRERIKNSLRRRGTKSSQVPQNTPTLPHYTTSPTVSHPQSENTPTKIDEVISAEWLDSKRRHIIRKLNRIDKQHRRGELLGQRIQRLRGVGHIPEDIATAMRQVTYFRNKAVYEEYELLPADVVRVNQACSRIDDWQV